MTTTDRYRQWRHIVTRQPPHLHITPIDTHTHAQAADSVGASSRPAPKTHRPRASSVRTRTLQQVTAASTRRSLPMTRPSPRRPRTGSTSVTVGAVVEPMRRSLASPAARAVQRSVGSTSVIAVCAGTAGCRSHIHPQITDTRAPRRNLAPVIPCVGVYVVMYVVTYVCNYWHVDM